MFSKKLKIALVHDHLAQDGGAEKVLKIFADLFPQAPIYTLLYEKKLANKYYKNRQIETSIIQKLPGGVKHYKWYMPFMPIAVEFFDLREYDLILSDTSSFAKGVITSPDSLHICYCHTPTRYLWSDTHQYINELKYNKYFKKIISLFLSYIRIWDRLAADRVDYFIANSYTVQKRIKKYYKKKSDVIYPPVDIEKFKIASKIDDYFLAGGRLVPYKRFDIIIQAFHELNKKTNKEYKLKIFGSGIDQNRLEKIAKKSSYIEFLGQISNKERNRIFSECQAFINPQIEDFGITIVEALASGRPVISINKGGALEIIKENENGIFIQEETSQAIYEAILKFNPNNFDPKKNQERAQFFQTDKFKKEIINFINSKI